MTIRVQLFALARELCRQTVVELDLRGGSTVSDLRRKLAQVYPVLSPYLPHFVFAANAEYVSDETLLNEGDSVACIPPVSGG